MNYILYIYMYMGKHVPLLPPIYPSEVFVLWFIKLGMNRCQKSIHGGRWHVLSQKSPIEFIIFLYKKQHFCNFGGLITHESAELVLHNYFCPEIIWQGWCKIKYSEVSIKREKPHKCEFCEMWKYENNVYGI